MQSGSISLRSSALGVVAVFAASMVVGVARAEPPGSVRGDASAFRCESPTVIFWEALVDPIPAANPPATPEAGLERVIARDYNGMNRARVSRAATASDGRASRYQYRDAEGGLVASFQLEYVAGGWYATEGAICLDAAQEAGN